MQRSIAGTTRHALWGLAIWRLRDMPTNTPAPPTPLMPLLPTMLAAELCVDPITHVTNPGCSIGSTHQPAILMAIMATAACSTKHHMPSSCGMLAASNTVCSPQPFHLQRPKPHLDPIPSKTSHARLVDCATEPSCRTSCGLSRFNNTQLGNFVYG